MLYLPNRRKAFVSSNPTLSGHSTLPTNLLCYYPMNDASGNMVDATGNLGNLIRGGGDVGHAGPGAGPLHGSYCYRWIQSYYSEDVTPDTVGHPRLTATNPGASSATTDATMAAWIYCDSSLDTSPPSENATFTTSNRNVWGLFGFGVSDRNTPMMGLGLSNFDDTNVAYRSGTSASTSATTSSPLNGLTAQQWSLFIYRLDNTVPEVKIYLNNSLINTVSFGTAMNHSLNASGQLVLCRYINYDWTFGGYFNGFGIWDKALSTDEMTDLYNSGAGLPYS